MLSASHPPPATPGRSAPPGARPGTRQRRIRRPHRHPRTAVLGVVVALLGAALTVLTSHSAGAETVGRGSYTTQPPGPLPSGCADLSTDPRHWVTSDAPSGAVPTNDWWSSILWKRTDCAYGEPLFAQPLGYRAQSGGLGVSYSTTPAISGSGSGVGEYHFPYAEDFVVGVAGLAAPEVKVDDWSDWTVSPLLSDGAHTLRATIGSGLPFAYFRATGGDARIQAAPGAALTVWSRSGGTIGYRVDGHDYVAFAPTGATWSVNGSTLTSALAGKGYFSVAVLPTTSSTPASDRAALAAQYGAYAHNHVTGTAVSYRYDESDSTVTTTYRYTTDALEGSATGTVAALLPHQWRHLASGSPLPQTYLSSRGPLKILAGIDAFTTSMVFHGVLPEVPAVADGSGTDAATLQNYLNAEKSDPTGQVSDDTYWTGKGLGRAARLAEIADQTGNTDVRDAALEAIRSRLTDWFTASANETKHLFYYDDAWGTLIGYPASYGSDQELNDHHFHYGYYVAAAATLAKFDPEWASSGGYGGMVDLLIRDADNYDRSDKRFPYLRDFDIYSGHDWASGHGSFAAGNNQESSSEGMNFDNALIQWGVATGDKAVRDAGIYMYTTQAAAIDDYWFDLHDEIYPSGFPHRQVGMVWGNGGAYSTWFSSAPEQIQGINLLPVTGGHLYLGRDPDYVKADYQDMLDRSGGTRPTLWTDIWYEYLALGDGDAALADFRADNSFTSEEGESKAHTFHWIRNLAALGTVDSSVTADSPMAAVFVKNGRRTYVAANATSAGTTVHFSDGTSLPLPAGRTVASGAQNWSGGNATGGPTPTPTPTPTDTATPTGSPSPTGSPTGGTGSSSTLYLQSDGTLSGTTAGSGSVPVPSADGANHDGAPYHPVTLTATGLDLVHDQGAPSFDLAVDAGAVVGSAVQAQLSYDCTADGTWDRVETYRYFATDPVAGWEHYTDGAGLVSAGGAACDLRGGTVQLKVWSALGAGPGSLGTGDLSVLHLPYRSTAGDPTGTATPTTSAPSSPTLYVQGGGDLTAGSGTSGAVAVPSAGGANHDGTPYEPVTSTATGLTLSYTGGAPSFDLAVDAGAAVGSAVQAQLSYDCTADGTWDRVETYRYFATDPVAGWEHYTDGAGLVSAGGAACDLRGGTVQLKVWSALGAGPGSLGTGDLSVLHLPYA
ncbi:glycoside hydrolase [Streptomyces actuosus]|uniref:glucan endo-1,3-beta-D-glucosidase n=1 Tax=Streptomyces actuosus TaxID=1885 RepID=A0ABS2W0W6_STRAS|nr:glycosyl hydrolase [Streptomyces actuosus]MBN0049062.1 glycoside hydrolase [Streptomyces actuosus]